MVNTNPTVFQSKGAQAKVNGNSTVPLSNPATATVVSASLDPVITVSNQTSILDKAKAFLTKPISVGSKIQYWHIGLGAIALFVLYVEFMADRKTQRKLKFW